MTTREIPTMSTTILRAIAGKPSLYVTEKSIARLSNVRYAPPEFDLVQTLITYITAAGRLVDEALPLQIYPADRTSIAFKNAKISGKYLKGLVDICSRLEQIDLSGCFQISDDTVIYIIERCTGVSLLNIRNCRKITDAALEGLCAIDRHIIELDIGGNFNITKQGLNAFISSYRYIGEMKYFHISGLPIGDDTLQLLAAHCKSLTSLSIGYADVSEAAIAALLQAVGSELEFFSLSWICTTPNATNAFADVERVIDCLVSFCPRLVEVEFNGLKAVTLSNIQSLIDGKLRSETCESLKTIHLKFIGSSKTLMESSLLPYFPFIKFVL